MNRWRAPLLVGLVGIAAVVAFVLLFGTVRRDVVGEGEGYRVYADFEDVSGLAASSRVTISGVPVGTMERFDLVTREDGSTRARVWIRMGDEIVLYRGTPGPGGRSVNAATITRRAATMLGDYYLEISPGLAGERLREGDAIPNVIGDAGLMAIAKKLEDASDIFPRIQQIAEDIHVVTSSLSAVVGGVEGEARIRQVVDDVVRSAEQIAGAASDVRAFVGQELGSAGEPGRFGRIVANVERFTADASRLTHSSGDDLARTIANIEAISADLREVLSKPATEGGDPGRLDRAMARIEASLDNLERATGAVARIAEQIDRGEGSIGRLVKDDAVVDKAETVIDDLGGLVGSVSRLKTEIGFRSEFNVFQRALKNYLSLRFVPDRTKYYLIELVWDPRGKTSTYERVTYTNDPRVPGAVAERVVETREGIKFSMQMARSLWLAHDQVTLTGRFGLIESTGGVGGDLGLWGNTFNVSADLFDFSGDTYPRLKMLATYRFLDYLYVTAGVDDVINARGRDYFVGAGFRFMDADIKALLFTAPTPSL